VHLADVTEVKGSVDITVTASLFLFFFVLTKFKVSSQSPHTDFSGMDVAHVNSFQAGTLEFVMRMQILHLETFTVSTYGHMHMRVN
jgi:hypothetical protein